MAITTKTRCPACGLMNAGPTHICSDAVDYYKAKLSAQHQYKEAELARQASQMRNTLLNSMYSNNTGQYAIPYDQYNPYQNTTGGSGVGLGRTHTNATPVFVTVEKVQEMIREALVGAAQDEKMKDVPVVTPVQVARAINSALDSAAEMAAKFGAHHVADVIRGMQVPV